MDEIIRDGLTFTSNEETGQSAAEVYQEYLDRYKPKKPSELEILMQEIGDLENLTTVAKTNLVGAVNEVKEQSNENATQFNAQLADTVIYTKDFGAKGDANHFNDANGKWYVDERFTTLSNDDTEYIQNAFDHAASIGAAMVIVSGNRSVISSVVRYRVHNSTLKFKGELVLDDKGVSLSTMLTFTCRNVDIMNIKINGNRDKNIVSASRGTQANFACTESSENLHFYGGYSINATLNHVQAYGENITFNNILFDASGEHGLYLLNKVDDLKDKILVKGCVVRNWGLAMTWASAGISLRDYKMAIVEDTLIEGGAGNTAHGIQSLGRYNVTNNDNQQHTVRNCKILGTKTGAAFWSKAPISIMENCTVSGTPFERVSGVRESVLRNITILEKVYSYNYPAHTHENCTIYDPFQWRPTLDSKWINCTWIGNQHTTDTPGGYGILMDLGHSGTDVQHDFINCTFKDTTLNSQGLIRARSKKNLFSGITYVNCGKSRVIGCGAGTTVVFCKDIDNTGVTLRDPQNAYLITHNNLSGYVEP